MLLRGVAALALSGLAVADAAWGSGMQGKASPRGTVLEWGQESGGLRSSIALPSQRVCAKEPLLVAYRIKNVSDREQTVWHTGFWPDHRIEVTAPSGKAAQLTQAGEQVRAVFDPAGIREKTVPVRLAPGQVDDAWQPHDLRAYFVLDAEGEYAVQYIYHRGSNRIVRSNAVKFAVAECR